ncbi:MAG: transposase family protein [Gemmataceae bacterium]
MVRRTAVRFAKPFQRITRTLERYALDLLSHMTIQAVAEHLHLGWDCVKTLLKRRLQTQFGQPKLKHVKRIAIGNLDRAWPPVTSPSCSMSPEQEPVIFVE